MAGLELQPLKTGSARILLVTAAQFLTSLLPGADPPPAADAGRGRVLLWIRAGALSGAELDSDAETTPRLRELVLHGVTAAELTPGRDHEPNDPSALASALFGSPFLERFREALGSKPIRLDPEPAPAAESAGSPPASAPAAPARRPGVTLLERRFGAPPALTPGEQASILRIRSAIGEPMAGERQTPAPVSAPAAAAPPAGRPAAGLPDRVERALSDGALFVIACERVDDPSQAPERDRLLGEAAARAGRAGAVFLVLSASGASGTAPPRATLVAAGPGVRRGRIIAEARPLEAVAATALAILGVRPAGGAGPTAEGLDVLER